MIAGFCFLVKTPKYALMFNKLYQRVKIFITQLEW